MKLNIYYLINLLKHGRMILKINFYIKLRKDFIIKINQNYLKKIN